MPNKKKYELYALNKTEYFYDKKNIAFYDKSIETGIDTFVELFSFNLSDTLYHKNDTSNNVLNDSILNLINGNIIVNSNLLTPCILQLIKNETLVREEYFFKHPLMIKNVLPGAYFLKYIQDADLNKKWSTGSLQNKLWY